MAGEQRRLVTHGQIERIDQLYRRLAAGIVAAADHGEAFELARGEA